MKDHMNELNRRMALRSLGLAAGASLLAGCGGNLQSSEQKGNADPTDQDRKGGMKREHARDDWRYVRLDPAAVAAETYRLMPEGGCMYGLFAGIITTIAKTQGEPFLSFPLQMMKYGAGGVGHWGSLCGAINGGAAIVGLFDRDKARQETLIAHLFSWYEAAQLPGYRPDKSGDSPAMPKSVAGSVLCHVSAGKWCKTSGSAVGSPEMKERCRRLTADVATKTVELLNASLQGPCEFAGHGVEVKSCLLCHGKDLHDTMGQMRCSTCHQQLSTKHPTIPSSPAGPSH
jgi:hypothetical protein